MKHSETPQLFGWPIDKNVRLLLVAISAYAAYILGFQLSSMLDLNLCSEECRVLFTQHRFADPSLLPGDIITDLLLKRADPPFYVWLAKFCLHQLGFSLPVFHHGLALLLYTITLFGFWVAGKKLGGWPVALLTLIMALLHTELLYGITAARPQSFAYPLLIWFFVAMLHHRPRWMGGITVLAGGLYQPAAVICGIILAVYLLITANPIRQPVRQTLRNLVFLALVGSLTLWLVLSTMERSDMMANSLTMTGKLSHLDFAGFSTFNIYALVRPMNQYHNWLSYAALGVIALCGIAVVKGFALLPKGSQERRTVQIFWMCTYFTWLATSFTVPQYSYRILLYPVMTLVPLLLPLGLARVSGYTPGASAGKFRTFAVLLLALAVLLDSDNHMTIGYEYQMKPEMMEKLSQFSEKLPKDTVVAGWPSNSNKISELFPYYFKRATFVSYKNYFIVDEAYLEVMLERVQALINVLYAVDSQPLITLHEQWGVDYLVVMKEDYAPDTLPLKKKPFYPFGKTIDELAETHKASDLFLASPPAEAVVYEDDTFMLLKLDGIASEGQRP